MHWAYLVKCDNGQLSFNHENRRYRYTLGCPCIRCMRRYYQDIFPFNLFDGSKASEYNLSEERYLRKVYYILHDIRNPNDHRFLPNIDYLNA